MGKAEMSGVGHPGVGAGCLGADVQNRVDFVLQEPDVRPDGPDVHPNESRSRLGRKIFNWGRKWMIPKAKLERFCGWKVWKLGGKIDLLKTQRIHGSKSTKHHHTNKSQKKLGAIFWWGFLKLGRNQQN